MTESRLVARGWGFEGNGLWLLMGLRLPLGVMEKFYS